MIQRIQSIYLLLVTLVAGVLPLFVPLYVLEGSPVMASEDVWIISLFVLIALEAFATIFLFKNRQQQLMLNVFNMLLNLILLGVFVYRTLMMSGETAVSEKGIGMLLPVISIVLLVLANRAIRKDERLVKSADRLR
jgi:transcription termination factor Rho